MGEMKKPSQLLVGFALETHDEVAHARKKIASKNLDWIVLNSLSESGSGFQVGTNRITILDAQGGVQEYPLKSKEEVANDIVQKITEAYSDD